MDGKQASQINNLCAESRHFNGRHNNVRWKSQTMIIFHKASFTASSQKRTEQTCFCEQALLLTGCFPLAFKRNDWKRETFYSSSSTLSPSVKKKKTKWQNHQANTKQTVVFAGQLRIVLLKIGFENIGCRWKKKKNTWLCPFFPRQHPSWARFARQAKQRDYAEHLSCFLQQSEAVFA